MSNGMNRSVTKQTNLSKQHKQISNVTNFQNFPSVHCNERKITHKTQQRLISFPIDKQLFLLHIKQKNIRKLPPNIIFKLIERAREKTSKWKKVVSLIFFYFFRTNVCGEVNVSCDAKFIN